ncbi:MAG: YihY/virulence factor BrkB family protein [Chitinophagaceae bacterium]|nr:MAG: YihY/virulence factor BrkB family protein [Chitinophagaceae bacterium]
MAKLLDKPFFKIAKNTFSGFSNDKGLKLSASLAYYTIFALAPLLLLLISLAGIFLGKDAIQGKIFGELRGLLGTTAALQVQDMIASIELSGKSTVAFIIGIVTSLVGATSIFGEIQDSINSIWKVKAKPKRGWLKMLKDRLLSSSIIVSLGFLLVVSLVVNGALLAFTDRLSRMVPQITVFIAEILNVVISFLVITVLFATIFKVLPDVKIKWKDVRVGAIFTACLFMIGRFVIGLYISTTGAGSTFGAAGSLIVILLWVYYTAAILYLGAEFTQVYAEFKGHHIEPADFAVHIEQKEVEKDVRVLPPQHEDMHEETTEEKPGKKPEA